MGGKHCSGTSKSFLIYWPQVNMFSGCHSSEIEHLSVLGAYITRHTYSKVLPPMVGAWMATVITKISIFTKATAQGQQQVTQERPGDTQQAPTPKYPFPWLELR